MNVTTHPRAVGGLFQQQGHSLLIAFSSVLDAIKDRVLVLDDDIGDEQMKEIGRELNLMRVQLDRAFEDAGLEKFPGSFHLQRGAYDDDDDNDNDNDNDPRSAA